MTISPMTVDGLITYRDDATGERAALTAAEVGGWTAATAALLTQECGLRPGDQAAVLLPPHWQTAAVLLGAWSAGLAVSFRGWATAGLSPAGDPLEVSFVEARRVGSWLDEVPPARHQFVLGLAPAAAPADPVPDGYRDFPSAVRPHLGAAARSHRPAHTSRPVWMARRSASTARSRPRSPPRTASPAATGSWWTR